MPPPHLPQSIPRENPGTKLYLCFANQFLFTTAVFPFRPLLLPLHRVYYSFYYSFSISFSYSFIILSRFLIQVGKEEENSARGRGVKHPRCDRLRVRPTRKNIFPPENLFVKISGGSDPEILYWKLKSFLTIVYLKRDLRQTCHVDK
jgi:hypothetical protein